jgi:hypothetical protein
MLLTFSKRGLQVDMAALRHMGDNDLKELGVPMVSKTLSLFCSRFTFALEGWSIRLEILASLERSSNQPLSSYSHDVLI